MMRFYFIVGLLLSMFVSSPAQTLQQALDATNLTWTTSGTGGAGGWFGQTTTTHDGVSAARSGAQSSISTSQTSTLQTTVTGPGTLTFWWSGSAPDVDGSQLSFVVGSVTQATIPIDGGSLWRQQTIYVGSGSQTLKWVYSLPGFAPNMNPGYVDQVSWITGSTAPVITAQPFAQSVVPGLGATFFVGAGGTPPLRYQWQLNGTNISAATNSSYVLSNAQAQNLGDYRVVISNSVGTNASSNASLEFGELAAWGYGSVADNRSTAPPGATNVWQISGGLQHSVLLKKDFTIVNWGYSNAVQSGAAGNVSNALNVAALNGSGVILNADGTVSAWGNSTITNVPANLTGVIAIAQGPAASYCLALKSDGKVVVWGSNSSVTNVPSSLSNVVSIAAGGTHCLALKSDGLISSWGDNTYGQRSIPASIFSSYPTIKPVAIAAGYYHSMVLRSDGMVFAWGNNSSGQTNVPVSAKGAVAIAAGYSHSMALRTNGVVVAWGHSFWGQINVPSNLSNVVAIAAGGYHSLALVGNGSGSLAFAGNSTFSSNVFSLSLPTQCGRIFELDYKTSLAGTNWTTLPYVAGNGTNLVLMDSTATNSPRFYRVRRW